MGMGPGREKERRGLCAVGDGESVCFWRWGGGGNGGFGKKRLACNATQMRVLIYICVLLYYIPSIFSI